MNDIFNFECAYRNSDAVNVLNFRISDDTGFVLKESWIVSSQTNQGPCQRLDFNKENNYDRQFIINLVISSVAGNVSTELRKTVRTETKCTSIIIPWIELIKLYEMDYGKDVVKLKMSQFLRYKITFNRIYVLHPSDEDKNPVMDRDLVLSDQIHALLETGQFSDIILTDGQSRIRAHRNILSVRSEYFRKIFTKLQKQQEMVIRLKTNMKTMKQVLCFIYSGMLRPLDFSTMDDLFVAARLYQLEDMQNMVYKEIMKQLLSEQTKDRLCLNNAVRVFQLAKNFKVQHMEDLTMDLIVQNFADIKYLESWQNLQSQYPAFAEKIVRHLRIYQVASQLQYLCN